VEDGVRSNAEISFIAWYTETRRRDSEQAVTAIKSSISPGSPDHLRGSERSADPPQCGRRGLPRTLGRVQCAVGITQGMFVHRVRGYVTSMT
jgi:hypothetical protein